MRTQCLHLGARLAALALLFGSLACGDASQPAAELASADSALEARGDDERPAPEDSAATEMVGRQRVLFLGTSLTAGLGLSETEAYPARLSALLEERGLPIEAINAGVSGDTTAGGLERLDWLLRVPPDIVLIELGANDGLRGLPTEMTEANLREAIARIEAAGATVILAGMMMPPNYGEDYTREFAAIFPRVAEQTGSVLLPFLLEGVAANPELNLPDGIHPNADGHERIASHLLPFLVEALSR